MGFNLGEVFDPQFGGQSSALGDLYFMFTLVVFLLIGGHRAMVRGVRASFDALPLFSVGINQDVLTLMLDLFRGATILAFKIAAPVLVTMIVVDLVLGLIGRTIPQMNVMSAALSIRAGVGMFVVWVGLTSTGEVVGKAIEQVDGAGTHRVGNSSRSACRAGRTLKRYELERLSRRNGR